MAEEAANTEGQVPVSDSVEATIESGVACGALESTCNNIGCTNAESSTISSEDGREKSLEYADELMALGSKAAKEHDYAEATDYYSRALEIRVAHFGELAPECVHAYYKYGCALLYKAQEEADPLGSMPKKEGAVSEEGSNKDGTVNAAENGESSAAPVSNDAKQDGSTDGVPDKTVEEKDEEGGDESDDEYLADGDEDESDLDLAWKMLDVARAIVEKHSGDTMEKVDILSALAEVALEREDIETSLSDYLKALNMLEHLVEPDSRLIAELNFRVCLCLEIGSKPEEAIPYCQKAISICKSRMQRLVDEIKNSSTVQAPESSTSASQSGDSMAADKEAEVETLTGLCSELEKKLEDLQQLISNPKSILSDILGIMSAKAKAAAQKNSSTGATSSVQIDAARTSVSVSTQTVSTAQTSAASEVTHLGIVGRGVKRVVMSTTSESSPAKKPSIDPSANNGNGSVS